jgi:CTP:molybdopterin cytidylyltransferase MocA
VVAGLRSALETAPEAVLVLPVDHPDVKPATILDLAVVMQQALGASRSTKVRKAFSYALVPRHQRRRGHPVVLSPALALAVTKDAEAENLSDAVRRNARLVGYIDVKDPGVVRNRNRPGD